MPGGDARRSRPISVPVQSTSLSRAQTGALCGKTLDMGKRQGEAPVAAAAPATAGAGTGSEMKITGKIEIARLDRVKPNTWNPNRMTEFQVESTREGLRKDGWLAAYALLIWRTDEQGKAHNVIIDGEHRWRIASELGFTKGPMVFLDGISAKRAREMTIEFDNKRGKFDEVALRDLINAIGFDDDTAFRLGFDDDTFKALMDTSNVLPPSDFSEVSIDAKTDYTCPKCGYEWSGASSAKKHSDE
jgi:hypothetical protein